MALTRITKGVIKPNENYDTHNINSTGIVTAVGANFTGNVSVGGVLTYEDVTSIDSVGIITAQSDIHVGGGVSAVGVGTFGSLDISGDIDVDGHTNLDNVSIAGVTTMSYTLNVPTVKINTSSDSGASRLFNIAHATASSPLMRIANTHASGRKAVIEYQNTQTNFTAGVQQGSPYGFTIFSINPRPISFWNSSTERLRVESSGNISIFKDLDVDGHTNLDNVSVAGVTTFAQAAGAVTVPAGGDIRIANSGGWTGEYGGKIQHYSNFLYIQGGSNGIRFRYSDGNDRWVIGSGGHFDPGAAGSYDIGNTGNRVRQIYSTHVNISGVSTFTGAIDANGDLDVDGHTNLDNVSIAGVATAQQIRYSSGGGNWNGHPRSVVLGYSGSEYAQLGMGWIPTGTNGQHTSNNTDFQSRLQLHDGLQIYGSGASVTSGQTVTWKTVADFKPNAIKLYTSGDSNSEKLRIDSSGRVIIGKVMTAGTGPHYDDISINNSNQSGSAGSTGIDLISNAAQYGALVFSTNSDHEQGYIKFEHNSGVNKMRFGTLGTDRWQIYSSGNLQPATDSAYDIGSNSVRVRNIYSDNFYATSLSYNGNILKLGDGSRTLDNAYYDDIVIDNSDTTSGVAGGVGISLIAGNQSWGGLIFGDNDEHQKGYIKYSHADDFMQIVAASGQVRIMSNGSVNIGGDYEQTTYNLSVTHSSNFLRLKDSNEGNYDLRFMIQNSEANIWHYGTDDFVFGCRYNRKLSFITNAQKRMTISGNHVGINDQNPSYTLNVIGDNNASNGIGMLKGIIGVQNDTTAYGSYPTAGISFQTKYRTGPDVPLDVAAIYGGKENTTNGDKDGYMGFAVREEPGSGTQERMRITSDGNLIIGHTSGSNKLQIGNTGHSGYCIAANSPSYGAVIQVGDGATPGTAAALWIRNLNNGGGTTACFRVQGDGTVHFGDQTSTGKYNDGVKGASWYDEKDSWQQAQSGGIGWSMWYLNKIGGTNVDNRMIQFNSSGSAIGYISRSGSNIVYQTSSDYRLKKDVVALPNSIDRVKQLRPVAFKWIEDNSDMEGFLAHEAQEVVPYAVSGKKDEVATEDFGDRKKGDMIVQAIDYGEFTPLLTAAMKELIAKVETLEAEVAALKGS